MAVVDKQKVDLLYKKLFGVSKTDFSTLKGASNEVIPSPALLRGDQIWTQANSIIKAPAEPAEVNNIVERRTIQCLPDTSTTPIDGVYPTWISKTALTSYINWISPEFGPGYLIEVFIGDPNSGGTKIFDAGINDKGAYYFDYMSGILNFTNYSETGDSSNVIPDGLGSGDSIWIRGYRYKGLIGISDQQEGKFGNLQLIDNTITATNEDDNLPAPGDVIIKPRLTGFVRFQGSRVTQHASDSTTGYDGDQEFNSIYEKTTLLARGSTTNLQEVELTLDGLTPGATNRFFLEDNHTYKVNVNITAKLDGGTDSAIWNIDFLASRGANASTTQIIGNTIIEKVAGSENTAAFGNTVTATDLVNNKTYRIKTLGDTIWASVSQDTARDYEVGSVFIASGPSASTTTPGTATEYLTYAEQLQKSWSVKALADTTDGVIKILVKGPDKINVGDPDKTIKWLAAINTLDIFET